MLNDAKAFFAGAALRRHPVKVRDMEVLVRELTVHERGEFLKISALSRSDGVLFLMRTCCIREDGTPLFGAADEAALRAAPVEVADALAAGVLQASRLLEDDEKNG